MAHHNHTPLHHILRLDPNFPDLSLYLGPLASGKVALDESLSDPVLRPENNGHYPQQNGYQIEPLSPDSDVPSSILSASPSFNALSESGGELSILDALATFDDRTTQLTNNAANQIYGFKPDIQRQQTLPKLQPIPIPPLNIPGETLGHPFPTPSPSRSDVPPTSSSYFSLSRSSLGPALMALWSDNHSSAQSSLDTINPVCIVPSQEVTSSVSEGSISVDKNEALLQFEKLSTPAEVDEELVKHEQTERVSSYSSVSVEFSDLPVGDLNSDEDDGQLKEETSETADPISSVENRVDVVDETPRKRRRTVKPVNYAEQDEMSDEDSDSSYIDLDEEVEEEMSYLPSPDLSPPLDGKDSRTRNKASQMDAFSSYHYPNNHTSIITESSSGTNSSENDASFNSRRPIRRTKKGQSTSSSGASASVASRKSSKSKSKSSGKRFSPSVRPFKCTFPSCSASFSRNHDLKRHETVHTGEKNHVCDECNRAFGRRDALTRHLSAPGGKCKALYGGNTRKRRKPA